MLQAWGGDAIAQSAKPVLPLIAWSTALMGLNVTGSYAMFALGRVRAVTWLNLVGGAAMMLLIALLLPRHGVYGIAMARLCYGPITLLVYLPLAFLLRSRPEARLPVAAGDSPRQEAGTKTHARPRRLAALSQSGNSVLAATQPVNHEGHLS